jgi:hypothetical protein
MYFGAGKAIIKTITPKKPKIKLFMLTILIKAIALLYIKGSFLPIALRFMTEFRLEY